MMKLIKCKTTDNDTVWINIEKITSLETTVFSGYIKVWFNEKHHTVEFTKEIQKLIDDNLFIYSAEK